MPRRDKPRGPRDATAHRFYVHAARAGVRTVLLPDDEAHHLRHVLRLEAGADVVVFDGAGHEWRAKVGPIDRTGVQLSLEEATTPLAEPKVNVTLGIGVLKGDQMDAVVRDATALGAAAIAPFVSEHVSVPSRAWERGGAVERWHRVAVSSAKQCGRAVVPIVEPVRPFEQLVRDSNDRMIVAAVEPAAHRGLGARPLGIVSAPVGSSALVLVGPEGGWSQSELAMLTDRGAHFIQLGPRTLRAETAPTVLLSVLWAAWGW